MAVAGFPTLLSPLTVGPITLRNRIVFTGHDTLLQAEDGSISAAYIAYQVARARGGAGLQVLSAAAIDAHSASSPQQIRLDSDAAIPGLRTMAEAIHAEGGRVFAQLLQAGREIFSTPEGTLPVAYSASATPSERFRVLPREMSISMIGEVIAAYAAAARRALEAGLDGVEIVGNHGNLPAQFLAAAVNRRTDDYGGSIENRMRLTLKAAKAIRGQIGRRIAFGVRLSADELDGGATAEEALALCRALDAEGLVDYLSLVVGNQATRAGCSHVVAPMDSPTGYVADYARTIKQAVRVPVVATGRFNTAHSAEEAIASGAADACGMTRAMICDPDIGRKLLEGRAEDVRACIGCVQACIGHYQKHAPVSCIQFPESGRELRYRSYNPPGRVRSVIVVGGGPAGMKAAAIAARRGHRVRLIEADAQLGGQVRLAQLLPTREEFGGLISNLEREMSLAGVEVIRNVRVDRALIAREHPDVLILATGGPPQAADPASTEGAHILTAEDVILGARPGARVVIADSRGEWTGVGLAERLAADGHHVRLAFSGPMVAEFLPMYVRDRAAGRLYRAGVEMVPYARFFGADAGTAYFQHVSALQPLVLEDVDTVVTAFGRRSDRSLERAIDDLALDVRIIGDSLTPRTAEEAVLDGLEVGVDV